MNNDAFNLLHPLIQTAVYNLGWRELRSIQSEAISYLCSNNPTHDLVLVAPTASGKTEAVFLPLISNILNSKNTGVEILYVSPLKALINDQFTRIQSLCSQLDFPVTPWHGDVSATQKKKLLQNPQGIMLITPESIEAFFQNRSDTIVPLWRNLRYIVIDEIHDFIERPRGVHLRSLLYRICHKCSINSSIIGLSATVANPQTVAQWIRPNNPESVKIIQDKKDNKEIHGIISTEYFEPPQNVLDMSDKLYTFTRNKKCLVYANCKAKLEMYCLHMREYCQEHHIPNNVWIHHGSLSKEIRKEAEQKLKTEDSIVTFCSPTLELGIDIGKMDRIVFLDPPAKVRSLIQWIGRSGRETEKAREFAFLLQRIRFSKNNYLHEKIQSEVVQAVAMTELFLEGWQEPLEPNRKDYSTFAQQILSYIGEYRRTNLENLYNVIDKGAFHNAFSQEEFIDLLRSLKDKGVIVQGNDCSIGLTNKGERIVERQEFYSNFTTPEEWTVIGGEREIGSIVVDSANQIKKGNVFILSGHKWEVVAVYPTSKNIIVQKCDFKNVTIWAGEKPPIHKTVQQKMLHLYKNKIYPPYLSDSAKRTLHSAYEQFEILFHQQRGNIPVFSGSKVMNTLKILLGDISDIDLSSKHAIENTTNQIQAIIQTFQAFLEGKISIIDKIAIIPRECKLMNKYDEFLSDAQLNESYLNSKMDLNDTREFCKRFLENT